MLLNSTTFLLKSIDINTHICYTVYVVCDKHTLISLLSFLLTMLVTIPVGCKLILRVLSFLLIDDI